MAVVVAHGDRVFDALLGGVVNLCERLCVHRFLAIIAGGFNFEPLELVTKEHPDNSVAFAHDSPVLICSTKTSQPLLVFPSAPVTHPGR